MRHLEESGNSTASLNIKKQQKTPKSAKKCIFENPNEAIDGQKPFFLFFLWMYFFMGNQKMVSKFWVFWRKGGLGPKMAPPGV